MRESSAANKIEFETLYYDVLPGRQVGQAFEFGLGQEGHVTHAGRQ